jgi:hypothetical protein
VGEDASAAVVAEVATSSVGVRTKRKKSINLEPQESVGVAVSGWEVLERTREPISAREWVYDAKAEPKVRKGYASPLNLGNSKFPQIIILWNWRSRGFGPLQMMSGSVLVKGSLNYGYYMQVASLT